MIIFSCARAILGQNDHHFTLAPFETTLSDQESPFHGAKRCQAIDNLPIHGLRRRSAAGTRRFTKAADGGVDAKQWVTDMKKENKLIMGIGHRIKSKTNPDSRVRTVVLVARSLHLQHMRVAAQVMRQAYTL